jgi:hypothetical protein
VAAQEALEARYLFQSAAYNRSGIIVRAPNADLARDPRWGRTEEVYGRFLGSPVERPAKKLVGFARVTVPAGQTRRVDIPVRGADLAY